MLLDEKRRENLNLCGKKNWLLTKKVIKTQNKRLTLSATLTFLE